LSSAASAAQVSKNDAMSTVRRRGGNAHGLARSDPALLTGDLECQYARVERHRPMLSGE